MIADAVEGKFVRLVTADKKDAEFTRSLRTDDNNTKHMPKLEVGLEQQEKWLQSQRDSRDSIFFVVERLDSEPIGTFSLYNIRGSKGETGRMIIRGNQLETMETVLLFHDYVFHTVGLEEVYSEIEEDNFPAIGVAKSCGAVSQGHSTLTPEPNSLLLYIAKREEYEIARLKLVNLVDRFSARKRATL